MLDRSEVPDTITLEPSVENGIYEIESLCMNCHKDVGISPLSNMLLTTHRVSHESFLFRYRISSKSSSNPSPATIAAKRTTQSRMQAQFKRKP